MWRYFNGYDGGGIVLGTKKLTDKQIVDTFQS